eukprot:6314816-Prymnesium_polylepis.1
MAESTRNWSSVPSGEWVATEKMHGANLCAGVCADRASGKTAFSKRSGPLASADDFFGFRSSHLDEVLSQAVRHLLAACGNASAVAVYGELCGGRYPHPDVPVDRALKPVQCGVWYSPTVIFVAFDVIAVTEREGVVERCFLDFDDARGTAEHAGFMFEEAIARGSLEACLDVPVRFPTRVSGWLGLPKLLEQANLAEGVVVRSARAGATWGQLKAQRQL